MGWLWWSSPNGDEARPTNDQEDTKTAKRPDFGLTNEQRLRIFGKPGPLQGADQTREAKADKELEAFLNSLSTSESTEANQNSHQAPKTISQPEPEERSDHDRILPDGTLNISPAAIYPRTMSCREAFDQAFYCQSLGGKFNDIYRYGSLQSCSEHWGAFWFCMRTKSLPQKDKERQIRDYYAEREERKRKQFGSSEDVWDIREKAVERAFGKDPDAEEDSAGVSAQQ